MKASSIGCKSLLYYRQYRTKSVWRLCTPSACKFPVIFHKKFDDASVAQSLCGIAVKKERTTINCPPFLSYKFNFQSLSKCSCRQPQCLGYGVSLCYNILPSPNRITITSSSEIASMLHGTYPRRYVFSSSLSIACCMRLVSFSDLLL